jgi:hypothetical protein
MFNSSSDFDTLMADPNISSYWKMLNQAIVGALVWNGITDVGAIAGWLILSGVIGGFKAWLDSLGLPSWLINIINNILGWGQQQTQQQAQQTTQNLQQLVDTIANGNQAIVNLANDFLGWVQSQYPDVVKAIAGQTTDVLKGLQQSLTQAVSPASDNINALGQMSAQSRAALAHQMGYQLGVNQDLITQQFNLLHKEVMIYPSH